MRPPCPSTARRQYAKPKPKPAPVAPVAVTAAPKPKPKAKCKIGPPEGFSEVKTVAYDCDNVAARIKAKAAVDSKVDEIREQRKLAAAEAERKRKQELAKKEQLKKEQEALAASAATQAELSTDIAKKMIAVCEKKWAEGEHRCYCQKYIQFAPASIQANSSCK